MAVDANAFREALGAFPTGITIVTTLDRAGAPVGMTANSFNWTSVDPALILFSLDRRARSLAHFTRARHFVVNVLRREQERLSRVFATSGTHKWRDLAYDVWDTGCPVLRDALASFECEVEARQDGGDHVIFVGRVGRLWYAEQGAPLLYFRGRYTGLVRHPD